MGAAGVMIIGGVYQGWEVVSRVAETLPWIGAAFYLLNDLVDIVDTKFELEVLHTFFKFLRCVGLKYAGPSEVILSADCCRCHSLNSC